MQTLRIDGWHPPQVANGPQTNRWSRAEARKDAKTRIALEARRAGWQPVRGRARLRVAFVYPSRVRVDTDNLYARCKPVCDALVSLGLIEDDSVDVLDLHVERQVERKTKALVLTLDRAEQVAA